VIVIERAIGWLLSSPYFANRSIIVDVRVDVFAQGYWFARNIDNFTIKPGRCFI
jgi:hypothetical protein